MADDRESQDESQDGREGERLNDGVDFAGVSKALWEQARVGGVARRIAEQAALNKAFIKIDPKFIDGVRRAAAAISSTAFQMVTRQAEVNKVFSDIAKIDPKVFEGMKRAAAAMDTSAFSKIANNPEVNKAFSNIAKIANNPEVNKAFSNIAKIDPKVFEGMKYVLAGEAAKHLGVTRERLRQLSEQGHIPSITKTHLGRIYDRDVVQRLSVEGWEGRRSSSRAVCSVGGCTDVGERVPTLTQGGLPIEVLLCAKHQAQEQAEGPGRICENPVHGVRG